MNKRLLGGLLALLALSGLLGWTHKLAVDHGIKAGIDAYHGMCYNIGGMVVDQATGTVVVCKGLTAIPEEERQNFLDKPKET